MKHGLDTHIRSVHNYKTVKCEICDQSFTRQSNLTSHYKYVHDVVDNYLIMDDGKEVEFFECERCSFETRYEKNLRKHIITVHNTDLKFNCTECDYSSNRMDNLSKHIKLKHEDEATSFACNDCNFTSKFRYNLNRHVKNVHTY